MANLQDAGHDALELKKLINCKLLSLQRYYYNTNLGCCTQQRTSNIITMECLPVPGDNPLVSELSLVQADKS